MPTGPPSRSRTAMPLRARPSVHPVAAGRTSRLTAVANSATAPAPVNTQRAQPSAGEASAKSPIVTITAMPGRTSTSSAPARVDHDARTTSGTSVSETESVVGRTTVTR